MKKILLLLLISALLLSASACGKNETPSASEAPASEAPASEAPESEAPASEAPESEAPEGTPATAASETRAPASAEPSGAEETAPPVAPTATQPASGVKGLGITADGFIEAYNAKSAESGTYSMSLERRVAEETELGGWNIIPLTVAVDGQAIHSLKLYCDAQGTIAQVTLLCSAPNPASGSDLAKLDGDQAAKQSIKLLVNVLGGNYNEVIGKISSLSGEYVFSLGGFEYDFWGSNGMVMFHIFTTETGNLA